jgi:hypothetical protein
MLQHSVSFSSLPPKRHASASAAIGFFKLLALYEFASA